VCRAIGRAAVVRDGESEWVSLTEAAACITVRLLTARHSSERSQTADTILGFRRTRG
jgi:hypothetical protein